MTIYSNILQNSSKSGNFIYENGVLKRILHDEGVVNVLSNNVYEYQFFIKDHLGNTRLVCKPAFNSNGTLKDKPNELQRSDYYPFGMLHGGVDNNQPLGVNENRYLYNGKEYQSRHWAEWTEEDDPAYFAALDWYDYGARFYDPQLGRWHNVDPMIEKHYDYTGYAYVYNNPIKLIDPFGLDSVQRQQAIDKAREYVKENPGFTFKLGAKGKPGEEVDCSGLVSECIVAGDEPNPVFTNTNPELQRATAMFSENLEKVGYENVEEGNIILFDEVHSHSGIIMDVNRDENGAVIGLTFIHSNGPDGPQKTTINLDGTGVFVTRLKSAGDTPFRKWDTKPDTNKSTKSLRTLYSVDYDYTQPTGVGN